MNYEISVFIRNLFCVIVVIWFAYHIKKNMPKTKAYRIFYVARDSNGDLVYGHGIKFSDKPLTLTDLNNFYSTIEKEWHFIDVEAVSFQEIGIVK